MNTCDPDAIIPEPGCEPGDGGGGGGDGGGGGGGTYCDPDVIVPEPGCTPLPEDPFDPNTPIPVTPLPPGGTYNSYTGSTTVNIPTPDFSICYGTANRPRGYAGSWIDASFVETCSGLVDWFKLQGRIERRSSFLGLFVSWRVVAFSQERLYEGPGEITRYASTTNCRDGDYRGHHRMFVRFSREFFTRDGSFYTATMRIQCSLWG